MGYQRPLKTAQIVFDEEGDDLRGLEIELRTSVGMRFVYDMLGRAFAVDDDEPAAAPSETAAEKRAAAQRATAKLKQAQQDMRDFAEGALVGWNLVDDAGEPVPATADEFLARFSSAEAGRIFGYWVQSLRTVPAPLATGSETGETVPESNPTNTSTPEN